MRFHRPLLILSIFASSLAGAAEPLTLINMSVLLDLPANGSMTAGFVISNSSGAADSPPPVRLLVRAMGPSLRAFGQTGADRVSLVIPQANAKVIATYSANRTAIIAAANSVGAFPFTAGVDGDDAIVIEVSAGALTPSIKSSGGAVLVEVYKMP